MTLWQDIFVIISSSSLPPYHVFSQFVITVSLSLFNLYYSIIAFSLSILLRFYFFISGSTLPILYHNILSLFLHCMFGRRFLPLYLFSNFLCHRFLITFFLSPLPCIHWLVTNWASLFLRSNVSMPFLLLYLICACFFNVLFFHFHLISDVFSSSCLSPRLFVTTFIAIQRSPRLFYSWYFVFSFSVSLFWLISFFSLISQPGLWFMSHLSYLQFMALQSTWSMCSKLFIILIFGSLPPTYEWCFCTSWFLFSVCLGFYSSQLSGLILIKSRDRFSLSWDDPPLRLNFTFKFLATPYLLSNLEKVI